jgi:signal transduction histidine kinase/ActR/RegA family two-component response regulator
MIDVIRRSISRKLMLVVLATTFLALLTYGIALLIYDVRSYHDALVKDLGTQANIIAEVSAPALEFDDPETAQENLELLRTRPAIVRAAIFTPEGEQFAGYASSADKLVEWPIIPQVVGGHSIEGDRITVSRRIVKDRRILGTVYIIAKYEVRERLANYIIILGCVLFGSMLLAALISVWLQSALTKPIFAVTNVARKVMQSRDFSLRAEKFTDDEIGILVDAFNNMLSEVEKRAKALEDTNRSLEYEMSERQAAENALRIADRRKDEFLATLAHELRNPLAPLVNSLRILRLSGNDPGACRRAEDVMERQLKQMVRLVDDLLDVSRITTGKLAITKERVDIQSVMRAAIESSGTFIEACGHELTVEFPQQSAYVDADPVRLAQVFSNLLNNAAKYTDPGGHIFFSGKLLDHEIVVQVTDDGIGIANNMLHEIFDMFTQVDYSLERAQAGLGVGLALSKRLVELHGGALSVTSAGKGYGSTFSVKLAAAPELSGGRSEPEACRQSGSASRRVLLVDDNVDFVNTMAELLSCMGHKVRTVHDGKAAVDAAIEFAPEFAFLDIGMPGLNGYDLASRLRELPETKNSVLVAVTGWGQQKDREMSRAAGFDYHLVKPVDLGQVLEVLERTWPNRSA